MRPPRIFYVIAATALAVALLAVAAALGGVQEEVVEPFQEVRVAGGLGSGTVVKVADEVLVLTAAHVVEGAQNDGGPVHIRRERGHTTTLISCDIVRYSPPEESGGDDLALLKPADPAGLVPAALGLGEKLPAGRDVWYIGSPDGLHGSLERSIVNKPEHRFPKTGKQTFFLVNGSGYYGSSGGGVYVRNDEGKLVLVGVVTRAATGGPKTPLGCERPETVRKFLDGYAKRKDKK
jgi:S1-C subfamily serine protease